MSAINNEYHPLKPFLPKNAKVLMLGSFPPKRERWSMEFFYPNFQNDMWRIMGLIFYNDKNRFVSTNDKQFSKDSVVNFCQTKGIALFDTATVVKRLKDNASDKFLEVVENTDIKSLLDKLPLCETIVATGDKAASIVAEIFAETISPTCEGKPTIGTKYQIEYRDKNFRFYRMPSSSRAYPLSLDKKTNLYKMAFI